MRRILIDVRMVFALGLVAAVGLFAVDSNCAAQENGSLLQITAPAPNTIVNPGQTIPVSVISPSNVAFSREAS